MSGVRRQRGVAMLTALLIAAIVASLCVYLAWDRALAFRRATDLLDQDRARELCLGAEGWAARTLAGEVSAGEVDLGQGWAKPMPATRIGGGRVGGRIEDLQARLNVNNLVAGGQVVGTSRARLVALLEANKLSPGLADAIIDWIDSDDVPRGSGGAEDGFYMGLTPAYRPANAPLVSVSTLRAVRGMDPEAWSRLAPALTALPRQTPVNVNTAPVPVLVALGLDARQRTAVLRRRAKKPFASLADFLATLSAAGASIDASRLDVRSRYFMLRAEARVGHARAVLYSVLQVDNPDRVQVIERSWNTTP